ncbi:hypothetical protein ACFVT8_02535, partial [Lysinibacillus sp. NPDC058147]|uniref:hypothetical protein n=1 Tax=Lysinibacillus sp. NPDC058147 TaxID=3346357 RepID=UPI0036DF4187
SSAAAATLPLRFRTKNICCCRYVTTTLSHKKHLLLPLRYHYAFAQKTSAAAASLSRNKHLQA